jgi:hypothetical protein
MYDEHAETLVPVWGVPVSDGQQVEACSKNFECLCEKMRLTQEFEAALDGELNGAYNDR